MTRRDPTPSLCVSALTWLLGCAPLMLVAGLFLSPSAPHAAPDARVDQGVQAPHVALAQSADTPVAQGSQSTPDPSPSTHRVAPDVAQAAPVSPRRSPRALRPTTHRRVPIYRVRRSGQAHRNAP